MKNAVFPHKNSNIYSGIRELSEFVITKKPKMALGSKQALKFTLTVNKPQTMQEKKESLWGKFSNIFFNFFFFFEFIFFIENGKILTIYEKIRMFLVVFFVRNS